MPLTEFRRKHRGGQGVGLIALEGRKTGDVAAVQQVTEADEELLLISAGGQVIRTETNSINRYSAAARGVIVMRLAEGDRVVAIAVFRAGLAEQDGMGDDGDPGAGNGGATDPGRQRRRRDVHRRTGGAAPCTRTSSRSTTATRTRTSPGRSAATSARELGKAEVFQFANENIFVKILENVREKDVFLVQPTCHPVNQSIMELLIMIDAFKRASAGRITAVIPYYAYGRSDKKDQPRVPITARLIADMITVAGADRVLTMDLHQGQIQGFFNIPVDELTAVHLLSNYYRHKHIEDLVVVTDLGFAKRARAFAELLDAPLAIIEKRRVGNLDRAELMNVIGDGQGQAGDHRRRRDRHRRHAHRDHPGPRARGRDRDLRLRDARRAERPGDRSHRAPRTSARSCSPTPCRCRERKRLGKITTLSVAPLIGEAIRRIHRGESVGALFSSEVSLTQEMLLWEDGAEGTIDTRDGGDDEPDIEPARPRRVARRGR